VNTLLSNLTFPRKFAFIGLLVLLLLALPCTLLFNNLAGTLAMADRNRQGIEPLGAVLKLVQLTQQHRGQSAGFLAGQAQAAASRQSKQAEVDAAWGQVKAAFADLDDAAIQALVAPAASDWQELAQAVSRKGLTAPQSFARHTALVARQLAWLQAVAVGSGIARNGDLAGYHLQLAVVSHLPRLSETMGQLRARANAVLVHGEASAEDRLRLEVLVSQARAAAAELQAVLAELRRADATHAGALDASAADMLAVAQKVLAQAEADIVKAEPLNLAAPVFWASITQAIDQQFAFGQRLFGLLEARFSDQRKGAWRELLGVGAVLAVLLALGTALLVSLSRSVQRSLAEAVTLAQAVAAGDLTTPLAAHSRDELGQLLQALQSMQQALASVVGTVRRNADSVAMASVQIAEGNLDLSSRTEQQSTALQQTAATMDELGSTVRNNADNSRLADDLALGATQLATQGGEMVNQVVQTMRGINESSQRIAEIISVIDGIAFQTNILALNAAVEAARAGEQGRGFAVVASEVRMLAQRSADAARQIKVLISTSLERVERGSTLVDDAGRTMSEIVAAIERVKGIVAEISHASGEQSQGVSQVGQAVTEMDQATQRNAALVEQSAAAAENLKEQAQLLVTAVAAFRLGH
jgi:methyl-accepting chemotaxis protein